MGVSIGGATLVMLFAVLCLTVFSTLALVTANREWTLAQKSADAVTSYYAADSRAALVCRQICEDGLPETMEIDGTALTETDGEVSFHVAVDKMQTLCVTMAPSEADGWKVTAWRVEQAGRWEPDDGLNVWNGE